MRGRRAADLGPPPPHTPHAKAPPTLPPLCSRSTVFPQSGAQRMPRKHARVPPPCPPPAPTLSPHLCFPLSHARACRGPRPPAVLIAKRARAPAAATPPAAPRRRNQALSAYTKYTQRRSSARGPPGRPHPRYATQQHTLWPPPQPNRTHCPRRATWCENPSTAVFAATPPPPPAPRGNMVMKPLRPPRPTPPCFGTRCPLACCPRAPALGGRTASVQHTPPPRAALSLSVLRARKLG